MRTLISIGTLNDLNEFIKGGIILYKIIPNISLELINDGDSSLPYGSQYEAKPETRYNIMCEFKPTQFYKLPGRIPYIFETMGDKGLLYWSYDLDGLVCIKNDSKIKEYVSKFVEEELQNDVLNYIEKLRVKANE